MVYEREVNKNAIIFYVFFYFLFYSKNKNKMHQLDMNGTASIPVKPSI
jgi:hypothetical protein